MSDMPVDPILNCIRNCCSKVYKDLGFGLSESAYRKALRAELQCYFQDVYEEFAWNVRFRNSKGIGSIVSTVRFDLYIEDVKFILELKTGLRQIAIDRISKDQSQASLYLREFCKATPDCNCLLINFHYKGVQIIAYGPDSEKEIGTNKRQNDDTSKSRTFNNGNSEMRGGAWKAQKGTDISSQENFKKGENNKKDA